MRPKDWETLVWSIQRGSCVLLLGPEIGSEAGTSSDALAAHLAAELGEPGPHPGELPMVAQRYASKEGNNDLQREVVRFHATRQGVSPVHDALAALPFCSVISSCHDSLLVKALEAHGKKPVVGRYHFRGDNEDLLPSGTVANPLVYYLHGHVSDPESLVLTENDLLDFLVAVVSKNPPLPSSVRSELQRKGKSFLFLGFGVKHWHLRILLHVLKLNHAD